MIDKIVLVTPPDDILVDGIRLLLVDVTIPQSQMVSSVLTQFETIPTVVAYMWSSGDSVDWLIDKKHKSDIIIFNADSDNDIVVGYLAAQPNSYYFGNLKLLSTVNRSAIYNTDQIYDLLEKLIGHYVKI
jgi:hypothetical protein